MSLITLVAEVENLSVPTADTWVGYTLPVGTRRFHVKLRSGDVPFKIGFTKGGASGSPTNYISVAEGDKWTEDNLIGNPAEERMIQIMIGDTEDGTRVKLWVQTPGTSQVAEILCWRTA